MVAGLLVVMHRRALRAVDGGRGTFHIGCRDPREELVLAMMESIAEGCAARVRAAVQVRRGPLVERAIHRRTDEADARLAAPEVLLGAQHGIIGLWLDGRPEGRADAFCRRVEDAE